jgi:hypothetical protein
MYYRIYLGDFKDNKFLVMFSSNDKNNNLIPQKGEILQIDGELYVVSFVLHDYDLEETDIFVDRYEE